MLSVFAGIRRVQASQNFSIGTHEFLSRSALPDAAELLHVSLNREAAGLGGRERPVGVDIAYLSRHRLRGNVISLGTLQLFDHLAAAVYGGVERIRDMKINQEPLRLWSASGRRGFRGW